MSNKIKLKVTAETAEGLSPAEEEQLADAAEQCVRAKLEEMGKTVTVEPLGVVIQA